ncbi:hypothetical protein AKJ36_00905 [candidate division MSBL1 archaeon SCGC-AAA259I07]|uniref:FAD-dependent oxidoreductase 2 FAD-binding domain-containing protein n=1 Tax=candidate division MSBL1 archaeon SCGC-AAA259I07 TaxID=1698266 RepID=A0A133UMH6_9EURY|nr:hypothetical protein AKJ36_00905 [candidate division MSBL1 archaeon SCGC-AAA259I07]
MISHDVIIVGAGVAGMRAGIEAFKEGVDTAIVTKTYPPRCHSVEFQGGTAASIGRIDEDSWKQHMFDTVKGADYLADQDAVEILTRNAPEAIFEMENWGVLFSRKEDGIYIPY